MAIRRKKSRQFLPVLCSIINMIIMSKKQNKTKKKCQNIIKQANKQRNEMWNGYIFFSTKKNAKCCIYEYNILKPTKTNINKTKRW